jgi:hypothetical protein
MGTAVLDATSIAEERSRHRYLDALAKNVPADWHVLLGIGTDCGECMDNLSWVKADKPCEECQAYDSDGTPSKNCSAHCEWVDMSEEDYRKFIIGEMLSNGELTEEGHFSWSSCDTCDSGLGGNRETAHLWNGKHGDEEQMIHCNICVDCLCFFANGDLPQPDWDYHAGDDERLLLTDELVQRVVLFCSEYHGGMDGRGYRILSRCQSYMRAYKILFPEGADADEIRNSTAWGEMVEKYGEAL